MIRKSQVRKLVPGSYFEKELEYLASKGYQPSADLSIEHRFSKFQIGSTEESLEAIEKEESEAVVARIFGRKRPIRSKVG